MQTDCLIMITWSVTAQSPQGVAVVDWWLGRWIPAAARVGRRPAGRRRAGKQACKAQMKKYMSANYSQPDSPGSAGTRYPDEDY
ncbi:hypothetical protein PVAP13_7KG041109 [Panicum virgatum]|uniref:Uncharacterized protein n=1 Tax=Panicum virgatum TaxID=38727 RepID=A0A8T0QID7_PANVG|nr:hypothetical protein PVAP13_7KG041109 [Panicum virgatum]